MRVLVTGIDGYIGTVLGTRLLEKGFDVVGIDCGFYRDGWLYNDMQSRPLTLTRDVRRLKREDLEGFDAVVHLAELSNDPLGDLSEHVTYDINHLGSVALARKCKEAGVPRFVYTSSCSVYGAADDGEERSEESAPNPQTAYARCKVLVENEVGALAGPKFSPVFLRNATAFGASPRMRFDIVLNNLAGFAWTTKEIRLMSDGTPWRPLVHVEDICRAIILALEAPRDAIHNEIFNVGADDQNYQICEIATIVGRVFKGCALTFGDPSGDNRSYRTSFAKIKRHLPTFHCQWSAEDGASQLRSIFERIDMEESAFLFRGFTRVKQLAHLIATRQIDAQFYWPELGAASDRRLGEILATPLQDAWLIDIEPLADERGFFARSWCRFEFSDHGLDPGIAQESISFNPRIGTLRGLHFQRAPYEEVKVVRCTRGGIFDVIVDLRPQSPTFRQAYGCELTAENRRALYIPKGFAHGFQAATDNAEVLYRISAIYQPDAGAGYRYDDPAFAIAWPLPVSVVSERDLSWPPFGREYAKFA